MNPKEVLIQFCGEEARILGHPDFFTEEDAADILQWSDAEAESVVTAIRESVAEQNYTDAAICPWCVLYFPEDCVDCGYGDRHLPCREEGSTYEQSFGRYSPIVSRSGIQELVTKYFGAPTPALAIKEFTLVLVPVESTAPLCKGCVFDGDSSCCPGAEDLDCAGGIWKIKK